MYERYYLHYQGKCAEGFKLNWANLIIKRRQLNDYKIEIQWHAELDEKKTP